MTETSISGEPAYPHHVGIALRAVVFSAMLGGTAGALFLWGVRTLQQTYPPVEGQAPPLQVVILLVSALLGAPAIAALGTWILARPLISHWRRGGFSAVSGAMGMVLALIAPVADKFGGRGGLLGYAAVCAVGALLLSRRVAEGRRTA
jgi:hypothetical protein